MPQADKITTWRKRFAAAGAVVAAAYCVSLIFSSNTVSQLDAHAMQALTTDDTFKTISGNGSRAIHVFLSTDCSFCRQIEPGLGTLEDVTIYRHMLPGHSNAGRLSAIDVWCSGDPAEAWRRVAAGVPVPQANCEATALGRNLNLARHFGLKLTPSIVYDDGHVSAGMLSPDQIAEHILKAKVP